MNMFSKINYPCQKKQKHLPRLVSKLVINFYCLSPYFISIKETLCDFLSLLKNIKKKSLIFYIFSLVIQLKNSVIRFQKRFSFSKKSCIYRNKMLIVIGDKKRHLQFRRNLISYLLLSFFSILKKQEIWGKKSKDVQKFKNEKFYSSTPFWLWFEKKICLCIVFHFVQTYLSCGYAKTLNFFQTKFFLKEDLWCWGKPPRKKNKIFNFKPFAALKTIKNNNEFEKMKNQLGVVVKIKNLKGFTLIPKAKEKRKTGEPVFLNSRINPNFKGIFLKKKSKFIKKFFKFSQNKLLKNFYVQRKKHFFCCSKKTVFFKFPTLKSTKKLGWEQVGILLFYFNSKMKKIY